MRNEKNIKLAHEITKAMKVLNEGLEYKPSMSMNLKTIKKLKDAFKTMDIIFTNVDIIKEDYELIENSLYVDGVEIIIECAYRNKNEAFIDKRNVCNMNLYKKEYNLIKSNDRVGEMFRIMFTSIIEDAKEIK